MYVVVGIGINLKLSDKNKKTIDRKSTSLYEVNNNVTINNNKLCARTLESIIHSLQSFENHNYEHIGEKRTFDEAKLILDVEKLVTDDLGVGAAYYEKTEGEPTLEKFLVNEAKLRVANESRGRQKNRIDEIFSKLINGEG